MKLSDYMWANSITEGEMSRLLNCSISGLRKWTRGERVPRSVMMARIRDTTRGEVSFNDFIPPETKALETIAPPDAQQ